MRWSAFLVVLLLAGCAAPADPLELPGPNDRMDAVMVPGARPVLATAIIHEDPDEGIMDIADLGATTWQPRDVPLTYHGVHEAWDEWGRRVPAHVFRYEPMRLVITDATVSAGGIDIAGEWQPATVEYLFDLSDGRFLGSVNIDVQARGFRYAEHRDALVLDYILPLMLFMQLRAMEDVEARFTAYDIDFWFEETDDSYGQGGCTARVLRHEDQGERRHIVCTGTRHDVPLWAYSGDGTQGITFTLRGDGFRVAPSEGTAMPPREFARHEWPQVGGNLLAEPMTVPPSDRNDWAAQLHARTQALYLSTGFLTYASQHSDLFLHHVVAGWPGYGPVPLLDQVLGDDPLQPDERAWMMTTPRDGMWWGTVDTWHGGIETEDRHVARQEGYEFDASEYPTPTPGEIGPVIAIGEPVASYASFAPADPAFLSWLIWPDFGIDLGPAQLMWNGMGACFEDVEDAPYAFISGLTGQLLGAGYVQTRDGGCSAGGFMMDTPSGSVMMVDVEGHAGLLVRDIAGAWSFY